MLQPEKLETRQLTQTSKWHIYTSDLKRATILKHQLNKANQPDLFQYLLDHYFDTTKTSQQ
jgi:hypothetical protein